MGRIITVASGKGGVGKTTFVCNLAAALARMGKGVVVVDANLTTPNLGVHLGIPLYPITLQDVLSGDAKLKEALYADKSGVKILPADMSITKLSKTTAGELVNVLYKLADGFDFVVVDSAAGLGREAVTAIEAADELITLTNPEMPAVVDALKLCKITEKLETTNLGVVINKVRNDRHEMHPQEVREFLGLDILGTIPEDKMFRRALKEKQPLVNYRPGSKASRSYRAIASTLSGVQAKKQPAFVYMLGWLKR